MTTCLITGAAGFIGHHLVKFLLDRTDWDLVLVDKLTYAAVGIDKLREWFDVKRMDIHYLDVSDDLSPKVEEQLGPVDYIVHLAAETHVETSLLAPELFIRTNIAGTYRMLQYARGLRNLKKFLYFSTDEVFGPAPAGVFYDEDAKFNASSPYSASKACAEELAMAWHRSFGVPVVVSHCCNAFGERQHPEKFIPKVVAMMRAGKQVAIHTNSEGLPGRRMYVHVSKIAEAVHVLLENGEVGKKYNIPGHEVNNEDMVRKIASVADLNYTWMLVDANPIRPGWDFRYAITAERLLELGWEPEQRFDQRLWSAVESYVK